MRHPSYALLGTSMLVALATSAFARPVNPYLTRVSSTSVELRLATSTSPGSLTVEWGIADITENSVTAATCALRTDCRVISDNFESSVDEYYVFEISELAPGTLYQYRTTGSGVTLPIRTFSTAPAAGATTPFTFAAFGDNRSNASNHREVVGEIWSAVPDFVVNTGDHINSDELGGEDFFGPWFTFFDIEAALAPDASSGYPLLQIAPGFSSRGNHDDDTDFFLTIFRMSPNVPNPDVNDAYFSFDYGNAHFLVLDSNEIDADQIAFIDSDLNAAAANPDIGPMFAFFHHGAHSNGTHGGSTRTLNPDVAGAFQFYGVDVVFQGHDHLYTRYEPINGVTYIVTGGGGAPLYPKNNTNQEPIATSIMTHHFVEVTVAGNTLSLTTIDSSGNVIDTYAIADVTANGGVPKDFELGLPGDGTFPGCSVTSSQALQPEMLLVLVGPLAPIAIRRRRRTRA